MYAHTHRNLVSKYEDGHSIITTIPSKPDSLSKLLLKHARPLVGQMTTDNQLTVYADRPLLIAYFDLAWDLETKCEMYYIHNIHIQYHTHTLAHTHTHTQQSSIGMILLLQLQKTSLPKSHHSRLQSLMSKIFTLI